MSIVAPVSKFKRTNLKIYIVFCIIFGIWFGYDGYFKEEFIEKHTNDDGSPDSTLVFNQKSPPFFIGAAAVFWAIYLFILKDKKLIAEEKELVFSGKFGDKKKIAYDSIEKIDKTHFDSKGYFIITHKDNEGKEVNCRISDRKYNNLAAILDHLVAEIT